MTTADPKTTQLGFASLVEIQYQWNLQTPKPQSWDSQFNGDARTTKTRNSNTTQLASQAQCNYYDNEHYRQRRLLPRTTLLQRALGRTLMVVITVLLRKIEGQLLRAFVLVDLREHEILSPACNFRGFWRMPRCLVTEKSMSVWFRASCSDQFNQSMQSINSTNQFNQSTKSINQFKLFNQPMQPVNEIRQTINQSNQQIISINQFNQWVHLNSMSEPNNQSIHQSIQSILSINQSINQSIESVHSINPSSQ